MRRNDRLIKLVLFAMYAALLFVSKIAFESLPNIHPLSMLIMTFAVVYGFKALIPVMVYVVLLGLFNGFNLWWIPYLYLWPLQCTITALLPRKMSDKVALIVYPVLCSLFGFTFGALYAPVQALMFGYSPAQTVTWILMGIKFDVVHGISNFFMGMLVLPLSKVLMGLHRSMRISL